MSTDIKRARQWTYPTTDRYGFTEWERMQHRRERWRRVLDALLLAAWFALVGALVGIILHVDLIQHAALISASSIVIYVVYEFARSNLGRIFGSATPPIRHWRVTDDYAQRLEEARRRSAPPN